MVKILTAQEIMGSALREATLKLLYECSPKEIKFFNLIHAQSPWKKYDDCPFEELPGYYNLVVRTINKKGDQNET